MMPNRGEPQALVVKLGGGHLPVVLAEGAVAQASQALDPR